MSERDDRRERLYWLLNDGQPGLVMTSGLMTEIQAELEASEADRKALEEALEELTEWRQGKLLMCPTCRGITPEVCSGACGGSGVLHKLGELKALDD